METFVVLLRGINVGGNNVIKMKELRTAFSDWGYGDAITYIQSGNVVVRSSYGANSDTEADIEDYLAERFNYNAKVTTRNMSEMERLVSAIPREWEPADKEMRFNVLFLDRSVSPKQFLQDVALQPQIETVKQTTNELLWCAHSNDVPDTAMAKLPAHKLYKSMTIRNLNSTLKIAEIMRDF